MNGKKPLDPAILQQLLHRALGMIPAAAYAAVVIANWLLAHLATDWAMPSEVEGAFQTVLITAATLHIFRKYGLAALQSDTGRLVDGTLPKQPADRTAALTTDTPTDTKPTEPKP